MGAIKFSIVVAVAPERTPEILESLRAQGYPVENYEVIVEQGPNTSDNRNRGIRKARGEIVVFVDDDAIVNSNWLTKAEEFFHTHPSIEVVGGPQLTPADDTLVGKASGYALASFLGGAAIRNRYRKVRLNLDSDERELTSANLFCRREVFEKALFDPEFWPGEDPSLFNEFVAKGVKLAYCPDIYVYHRRRDTFMRLARQMFRYGYVRPRIRKIRKTGNTWNLFLLPTLFLVYLVLLPWLWRINWFFAGPLLLYVVVTVLVSIQTAVQEKNPAAVIVLPIVFLTIHLSYGAGFLFGAFRQHRNTTTRKYG